MRPSAWLPALQSDMTWILGLLRTGTEEPGRAGHLRLKDCDIPFPWPAFFGFRSGHFSCLLCVFGNHRSVKYIATRGHGAAEFHHPLSLPLNGRTFQPIIQAYRCSSPRGRHLSLAAECRSHSLIDVRIWRHLLRRGRISYFAALLWPASVVHSAVSRADEPCAADNCEGYKSGDDGEPSARCCQCARAGPATRRQRLGKSGNARRGLAAPKTAALCLHTKPELN